VFDKTCDMLFFNKRESEFFNFKNVKPYCEHYFAVDIPLVVVVPVVGVVVAVVVFSLAVDIFV